MTRETILHTVVVRAQWLNEVDLQISILTHDGVLIISTDFKFERVRRSGLEWNEVYKMCHGALKGLRELIDTDAKSLEISNIGT